MNDPVAETALADKSPESQTDSAKAEVSNQLSWLHDVITSLEKRLEPVKISLPGVNDEASPQHGSSALVTTLDTFAGEIASASSRIQQLLMELEV